jgi:hypothetical protein
MFTVCFLFAYESMLMVPTGKAYNKDEAIDDARVLAENGARLIEGVQGRNKWGSLLLRIEPGRVWGVYSVNGWIAGAFR